MSEYNFELFFRLKPSEAPLQYLDALYEAGCDDATVSTGMPGFIALFFTREAKHAKQALITAIEAVKKAVPHARLSHAAPYLLNLSELAFEFGCTKQNMRKYARGERTSASYEFPMPVITGKTSYWLVAEVAQWLREQGGASLDISDQALETYYAIWSLNQAIENMHQPNPEMTMAFAEMLRRVA